MVSCKSIIHHTRPRVQPISYTTLVVKTLVSLDLNHKTDMVFDTQTRKGSMNGTKTREESKVNFSFINENKTS